MHCGCAEYIPNTQTALTYAFVADFHSNSIVFHAIPYWLFLCCVYVLLESSVQFQSPRLIRSLHGNLPCNTHSFLRGYFCVFVEKIPLCRIFVVWHHPCTFRFSIYILFAAFSS